MFFDPSSMYCGIERTFTMIIVNYLWWLHMYLLFIYSQFPIWVRIKPIYSYSYIPIAKGFLMHKVELHSNFSSKKHTFASLWVKPNWSLSFYVLTMIGIPKLTPISCISFLRCGPIEIPCEPTPFSCTFSPVFLLLRTWHHPQKREPHINLAHSNYLY